MISPYLTGGLVLDLFAGTGGLGIEALSRGMEHAVFIDLERKSIDVIRQNLKSTGLEDRAEVYRNEAQRALKALAKRGLKFQLVFLDPPYRITTMEELVQRLGEAELLEPGAIVVVEHDGGNRYNESLAGLLQIRRAEYGETAITIYRYESESSGASRPEREKELTSYEETKPGS